ncbi:MAG: hypothetical protein M2R46_04001 [Verrucomicrobia subdivision 3 bacterium]|nr:hypothetical protein [Limisphaerales bacterium]
MKSLGWSLFWFIIQVIAFCVGFKILVWLSQKWLEDGLAQKIEIIREEMGTAALARDEEQMKAIRSLKESVESLRGLMWGATGENKRVIQILQQQIKVMQSGSSEQEAAAWGLVDGSDAALVGGDPEDAEGDSEGEATVPARQTIQENVLAQMRERLQAFRESMSEDDWVKLQRKVDGQMTGILQNIEQRGGTPEGVDRALERIGTKGLAEIRKELEDIEIMRMAEEAEMARLFPAFAE